MIAFSIPSGATENGQSNDWRRNYLPLAAIDADDDAFITDFFRGFAGRLLPNDPLNIFPFLVFLSPLPMIVFLQRYKKLRHPHSHARQRSFAIRRGSENYNFADSSLPALNFATFLALILITAPV